MSTPKPSSRPADGLSFLQVSPSSAETARSKHSVGEGPDQPALLIGTAQTLSLLVDQLALMPGAPLPVAYIGIDSPRSPRTPTIGLVDEDETLCSLNDLEKLVRECTPSLAIISLPGTMARELAEVRERLRGVGLPERVVPPLNELLEHSPLELAAMAGATPQNAKAPSPAKAAEGSRSSAADPSQRTLDYAELIGRTPYGVDRKAVASIIQNQRVLITGAGGSIGSEIARIVATFKPAQIVLMERSENSLFEIDRQIARKFPEIARKAVLHDVVDAPATAKLLAELRPDVVFHAAAHKHVPLMEDHPAHAVTNNLFGTKSIADASLAAGVSRFVMISSDKAVNPTSVMGATKRLAEMYIQALHRQTRQTPAAGSTPRASAGPATRFSMVRFGNVLASACSVLPIWETQVADGGPITVTDPRMTRYFMTIHEAAMLVIQSAVIENTGPSACIHVLDMGEPVRILDLAMRFARARGFEPVLRTAEGAAIQDHTAVDASRVNPIDVVLTGARPGEKIHEELAYAAEQLRATPFPGIMAWTGHLGDDFHLPSMLRDLSAVRASDDRGAVIRAIRTHVPEMRSAAEQVPSDSQPAEVRAVHTQIEPRPVTPVVGPADRTGPGTPRAAGDPTWSAAA